MKFFQAGDTIVLLDENGKEFKSTEFALWMQKKPR
jgi:23S rRNA (pseudouridine1915-N3)-methyltransferase